MFRGFTRVDRVLAAVQREVTLNEYWEWVLAALLVLIPVDLFTTLYAARVVGVENESNPVMLWLLHQPVTVIIAVHVAVIVVVVGLFDVYRRVSIRSERHGDMMLMAAKTYLALLIWAGMIVFINNVSIIVFRDPITTIAV